VVAVSLAHYLTDPAHILLHNIYQRLYYIPILLACARQGWRAGLAVAAVCAAAYAPHILIHWKHSSVYQTSQAVELAMFGVVAVVAGALSDRERRLRAEAEALAAERDRALKDLEQTVETLRRADRLATLGTLAAGMAHEVRNPLGAIGGAVEIIDRDFPEGHPHREFVEILRQEIRRLNETVGRYLDYARQPAPDLRAMNADSVVCAAVDLVRKSAERSAVTIDVSSSRDLPDALADPAQVHQVLVNLLLNGIQAMPRGGVLEVRTSLASKGVKISIRDHGEGLPEGPVERIFEPFFTTREGGTGLGLAISRRIAAAHGGSLEARQAEGGGAVFDLVLPRVRAEEHRVPWP
jgi:signal transduction histidine kinase